MRADFAASDRVCKALEEDALLWRALKAAGERRKRLDFRLNVIYLVASQQEDCRFKSQHGPLCGNFACSSMRMSVLSRYPS